VNGGYSTTPEYEQAVKVLEKLGYEVKFFCNANQFMNMYTIVKW